MLGRGRLHRDLLEQLARDAATDTEILITGPTWLDKRPYAEFAHRQSPRAKAAFVSVKCDTVSDQLRKNNLFGHMEGAFNGDHAEDPVAAAEGGTLFLDEVDTLPLPCQMKLLRFIQDKEYRRLGETHRRHANLRLIAATSADLPAALRAGRFREDLFLRLRVIPIEFPPLWKRMVDVRSLLEEVLAIIRNFIAWLQSRPARVLRIG
jgi:DNA-binding NtrC family response regulator